MSDTAVLGGTRIARLPLRPDRRVSRLLGGIDCVYEIRDGIGELPRLRGVLARPATERVSLTLRVHSRAGIPLACTSAAVAPGDVAFESLPLSVLAMDAYAHLKPPGRLSVEHRVWSRRAFATCFAS